MTLLSETNAREAIARFGESLYDRGYVPGSSGNISVRLADGFLVSPTNSCLGRLDPARISKLDENGNHVSGDKPSKESFLHTVMYGRRDTFEAVVHLHSTYAVAMSCRNDLNESDALPAMTPYSVMKLGKLRLLPYYPPGDERIAQAVDEVADRHHAILLGNHGPVVAGSGLDSAVYAIEELEEAAKLFLLCEGMPINLLTARQIDELNERYPS